MRKRISFFRDFAAYRTPTKRKPVGTRQNISTLTKKHTLATSARFVASARNAASVTMNNKPQAAAAVGPCGPGAARAVGARGLSNCQCLGGGTVSEAKGGACTGG